MSYVVANVSGLSGDSRATAVSHNGAVIYGADRPASHDRAWKVVNGVLTFLSGVTGKHSLPAKCSGDSSVLVGITQDTGTSQYKCAYWSGNSVTEYSVASPLGAQQFYNASYNGAVKAGKSGNSFSFGSAPYAFLLEDGVETVLPQTLPADSGIPAGPVDTRIAPSGVIAAGISYNGAVRVVMRWTNGVAEEVSARSADVGFSSPVTDDGVIAGAFGANPALWMADNEQTLVALLSGGTWGEFYDISADGSIAVGETDDSTGESVPVFCEVASPALQRLPLPTGALGAWANAVSADGDVIVGAAYDAGATWAVYWTRSPFWEDRNNCLESI